MTTDALVARLLQAVRHDDVETATRLLDEAPALATATLATACAVGARAAVEQWLNAMRDRAALDSTTLNEALTYAVNGRVKRARGVSVEAQAHVVQQLLQHGANANASIALPDVQGRIPVLFFPSVEGNVAVARVLLEHGAHATDGESLYHAAQHDHRHVLELLRQFGAELSHGPEGVGNSPLYFLASHSRRNTLAPTVIRGMSWLLEHGADPNVPLRLLGDGQHGSQLGEVPLHRLAANGFGGEVMAMLMSHGARLEATRNDGATPYRLAVQRGNAEGAMWLLEQGADEARVRPTDRLLYACLTADETQAHTMLAAHKSIVADLTSEEAGILFAALEARQFDAVRLMLSLGWPLATESEWGGTALHWCAWQGLTELVPLLLDAGAPVNLRDSRYGSSPIAWAAHGSVHAATPDPAAYTAIVDMLIGAGASREESFNRWGESPASLAAPAVADVLRAHGFTDAADPRG